MALLSVAGLATATLADALPLFLNCQVASIQDEFEQEMGKSIYSVLSGVVENTFGFNPCPQQN